MKLMQPTRLSTIKMMAYIAVVPNTGAASYYVFQYIDENTISKCHQTLKQMAVSSPLCSANHISLL